MQNALFSRQQWTLTATALPTIERFCPKCDKRQPFECTEKFRVNAQGRKLDVWLIYHCPVCEARWNRPIVERCPVHRLDARQLARFQSNDVVLAREMAASDVGLTATGSKLTRASAVALDKRGELGDFPWEIQITPIKNASMRLDRLLAIGLGISRKQVIALWREKKMVFDTLSKGKLKRPIQHPLQLTITDL